MSPRGFSLVETLILVVILLVVTAIAVPHLKAYSQEVHLVGAALKFKGQFREARSIALRSGTNTAIRFEEGADGVTWYSVYQDGNHNGVLSADIRAGRDRRIAGPFRLDGGAPGVRVGINPGNLAPPPDSGQLDTADPIRFGRSNMLSFSPLGSATPGTFYLAGEGRQAAIRVTPGSSRVRLMICRNGGAWSER
jgi:Tfp pilus assembly major pilin PilA